MEKRPIELRSEEVVDGVIGLIGGLQQLRWSAFLQFTKFESY